MAANVVKSNKPCGGKAMSEESERAAKLIQKLEHARMLRAKARRERFQRDAAESARRVAERVAKRRSRNHGIGLHQD